VDKQLAIAQALKYAEELRTLHAAEREQRRAVEEALERLEDSYRATVVALAAALELRDDDTGGHAQRVTRLALDLTRRVDPQLAQDPKLEYGFLLHDIGKIGIRDAILLKPGTLTSDEFVEMRDHTRLGERIVEQIPHLDGVALEVVAAHHERWDGSGYPRGLGEDEIPLAARIFAICDAFDAMTNDRPYRKAMTHEAALAELERNAGAQFDPALTGEFLTLMRAFRRVA
jgi:HD-GYP domain-containing protein (c-di-GMP phosphodiesterase class II)